MTADYPIGAAELEPTIANMFTIARLRLKYPKYRITFRYVPGGEGMRYSAQAAVLGVHPFAVVTGSLAELEAELAAGALCGTQPARPSRPSGSADCSGS